MIPVLNLAVQNVASERLQMSPQMESLIKSKNTMANVCLSDSTFYSVQDRVQRIDGKSCNSQFRRMQLKGTGLTAYQGATEYAVDSFWKLFTWLTVLFSSICSISETNMKLYENIQLEVHQNTLYNISLHISNQSVVKRNASLPNNPPSLPGVLFADIHLLP